MPSFGRASVERLETCHDQLQLLCRTVVAHRDCTVIEGARSDEKQALLYAQGRSHLDGVTRRSEHQVTEATPNSRAVDLAPYYADEYPKIPWDIDLHNPDPEIAKRSLENLRRWYGFGCYVLGVAAQLEIPLIWGGDWNRNWKHSDQRFHDLPHFQLV